MRETEENSLYYYPRNQKEINFCFHDFDDWKANSVHRAGVWI